MRRDATRPVSNRFPWAEAARLPSAHRSAMGPSADSGPGCKTQLPGNPEPILRREELCLPPHGRAASMREGGGMARPTPLGFGLVCAAAAQPRWGCWRTSSPTQGCARSATLGFVSQSLWDCAPPAPTAAPVRIPTGFWPKAQGWRARAYLGSPPASGPQPQRGCSPHPGHGFAKPPR